MPKINTRSNKFYLDAKNGGFYVNKSASDGAAPTTTTAPAPINVGYTYNLMNLNYIGSINNSIYGLYYDD